MSRRSAAFWVILGVPISILDAWLSMQAMVGILNPGNLVGYATAAVSGMFFTSFAILSEVLSMRKTTFGMLSWLLIFLFDIATSTLCAIWYGLLKHPFSQRIRLSEIHYDPGNWALTVIYVGVVILAAWGCIQLGRAFDLLLERKMAR